MTTNFKPLWLSSHSSVQTRLAVMCVLCLKEEWPQTFRSVMKDVASIWFFSIKCSVLWIRVVSKWLHDCKDGWLYMQHNLYAEFFFKIVEMLVLPWALVTFLDVIYKRFVDVSVDEFVYILKSCKLPFIYFWRICDYNTIL